MIKQKKFLKFLLLFLIIACIALVAWFGQQKWQDIRHKQTPRVVVENVLHSIKTQDAARFEALVNIENTAESITRQMFSGPEVETEQEQVLQKLKNWADRSFNRFIQPEMRRLLAQQIRDYVATGVVTQEGVDRLREKPLLHRILDEFGGLENLHLQAVEDVAASAQVARVRLLLTASELQVPFELMVRLRHQQQSEKAAPQWQVEAVEGIADALAKLENARTAQRAAHNARIRAQMAEALAVVSIQKSAGVTEWGIGKGILVRLSFQNNAPQEIDSFHANLIFREGGELLKEVTISDADNILPAQVSEKSWPMTINPLSPAERRLFELELPELVIEVAPTSITFADGSKLELMEKAQ